MLSVEKCYQLDIVISGIMLSVVKCYQLDNVISRITESLLGFLSKSHQLDNWLVSWETECYHLLILIGYCDPIKNAYCNNKKFNTVKLSYNKIGYL
jgi:hypothetical protein